jgi:hypothetical protein
VYGGSRASVFMDLRPPAVTQARHRLKRRAVLTRHIPAHLVSESKRCVGGSSARNLIRVTPSRVELFQREHLTLVTDERNEELVLSRGQLDGMPVELDLSLIEVDVQGAVVEAAHRGKATAGPSARPPSRRTGAPPIGSIGVKLRRCAENW